MDPASQAPGHQEIGNQRNKGSEKQNTTSDIKKRRATENLSVWELGHEGTKNSHGTGQRLGNWRFKEWT
jgi:hypothetical protein